MIAPIGVSAVGLGGCNTPLPLPQHPLQTPSRSLQDLVGDHVQRQTRLTPELHHRKNSYYASIEKVLTELELRVNRNSLCFVKYLLL